MKKLRLDVEELRVDTFATGAEQRERGTVRAHLRWTDPRACPPSNNWYCSVGETCTWIEYGCPLPGETASECTDTAAETCP